MTVSSRLHILSLALFVLLLFLALPGESKSESSLELTFLSGARQGTSRLIPFTPAENPHNLTFSIFKGGVCAWSPDGTRMAFQEYQNNSFDLFVLEVETGDEWNLTNIPEFDEKDPAWSPDGQCIALTSDQDGRRDKATWDVFVMSSYGSDLRNLTKSRNSSEEHPTWSPDGTKIAFSSDRDGNKEIYVMDVDGTNLVNLTNNPDNHEICPAWSPDGTQIAFCSRRYSGIKTHLFVMEASGGNWVNLTPDLESALLPTWSPDGRKIAFASYWEENYEIFVMDADGGNLVNVSNDPGYDWGPTWRYALGSTAVKRITWGRIKTGKIRP